MREEDFIVSKTDTKGRITYANRIFMEFAGYPERELLGIQHNIVRHPDMPSAVFQMMWETLNTGREFFGYVKNMASDGSFYWTFANVTSTRCDNDQTTGYFSVWRKPRSDALVYLAPVYARIPASEKKVGPNAAVETSRKILESCYQSLGKTYDEFILSL